MRERVLRGAARRGLRRGQLGFVRTSGFFGRFAQGGELKFHDVTVDDPSISSAGTIQTLLNGIAQGTTESTRIGRKCTIRSINWRWMLIKAAASSKSASSDTVRVILYLDKQANGATAGVTDILETDQFLSFNNLANKSRFRTLMDRTYSMNSTAGGGDGTTEDYTEFQLNDSFYKKVNIPIEFSGTAGTIGEIRSNNIGCLILSETGAICALVSRMRLRFSDN